MEEHEFVPERLLQFGLQPCELLPGNPVLLTGKLRVQKNKERIPIRKGIIGSGEKRQVDCQRFFAAYVVVARREMQRLVRPGDFQKADPLTHVTRFMNGIARMDNDLYVLLLDRMNKGGVD